MEQTFPVAAAQNSRWRDWLAPVILLLLCLALYSINLDKAPRFDELYHVLAARGYLEYGEPRIAEGLYDRAHYFTYVVSLLFGAFGESLAVGRLPGVVCTSLLVVLIFVWVRRVASPAAAWLAALLFLVSPFAIQVAQEIRFYAPFMLLFWLAAMAVYAATASEPLSVVQRALYALAAVVCLAMALHLQPLAMIGAACLGLWVAIQGGLWLRARGGAIASPRRIAIALAVVAVAIVLLVQVLPIAELLHRYRHTPLFDAATRDHFWFYHQWLILYYPTLWPLFPLAALAALASRPRPAGFCLCVFVPVLILLSFGGSKGLLYVSFALPLLFVIWGMALAEVWTPLLDFIVNVSDQTLAALGLTPGRAMRTALVAAVVGFALLANPATIRSATMLAGIKVPPEVPAARWAAAADTLEPWLEQASIVITSSELDALYYLGDYDIMLSRTRLSESSTKDEFNRDERTGRAVIGEAGSVEQLMDCFADGLIVVDVFRWRRSAYIDDATADLIVQRAEPVPLPSELRLLAFHWTTPERTSEAACQALKELVPPD